MDLRPIRSPEWPTCPAGHLRPAVLDLVAEPRRDRHSRLATLARRRSRYRHLGGCRAHSGEAWLREGPTQRRPSCGFDISASAVTRQPRRAPTNSMPLIHLTIVRPSWTSLRGRTGAPWWNDGEAARSLSYAPRLVPDAGKNARRSPRGTRPPPSRWPGRASSPSSAGCSPAHCAANARSRRTRSCAGIGDSYAETGPPRTVPDLTPPINEVVAP